MKPTTIAHGHLPGIGDNAFWFEWPAPIQSKSNFRRSSNRNQWNNLTSFESTIQIVLSTVLKNVPAWDLGPPPPNPINQRPSVVLFVAATTLLDTGNLTKSLADACQGYLYHTDASIRAETVVTKRSATNQQAWIAFAQTNNSSTEHAAELTTLLTKTWQQHHQTQKH